MTHGTQGVSASAAAFKDRHVGPRGDIERHASERTAYAPRVLVVEDEPDIAALVAYQLTKAGFRVETVHSGREALEAVDREIPDLVVLDRMLPGLSGDEVLRVLRNQRATESTPVLILTAKRGTEDRIHGFELGADDYLTKPFSPHELALRVEAILRRARAASSETGARLLRAGPIVIDVAAHEAKLEGAVLNLTPTEYRLLMALVERRGRTQSRHDLLVAAWEMEPDITDRLETRTVDMHIRRLRSKLGEARDWIETVRGFGYRLRVP